MDFHDAQPARRSRRPNPFLALALSAAVACPGEALALGTRYLGPPIPTASPVFPLRPSPDGRYLVDAFGAPFPILGDSGWEAEMNLTASEQAAYLADRVGRGFTAVLLESIEHKFNVNKPPKNRAGILPFTTRLDGAPYTGSPNGTTSPNGSSNQFAADPYGNINAQAPDFTHPEAAYWSGVDDYVSLCEQKGVLVLFWPAYIGFGGGDEGWMAEMVANDAVIGAGGFAGDSFADNTKSRLWNYGAWIANRYRSATNILWVHGGDYGNAAGTGGGFTPAQKNAANNLFAGMKSVSGQSSVMHTGHWSRRSLATDVSFAAGSLDLESAYADGSSAQWNRSAYAHTPARPAFMIEGYYEGNPNGGEPNRRFQWWAQLSAIGGAFYGNEAVWRFDGGWASALNSQGAQDMGRLNAFVAAHAWETLVPSGLNGMKTLVTGGGGTANPQSSDYVAAAAASDGSLLVAYVPPSHAGAITVDMTAMEAGGSSLAKWFNPFTGSETVLGTFPNTGTRTFTPPGNNGSGFSDWVLVMTTPDTPGAPPTVASPASADANPVNGTTTILDILGADDGGEAGLTYRWTTVGTPPAPVTFSANGTNAAKSSTATFSHVGTYTLEATITNGDGQSVTSHVEVTVSGLFPKTRKRMWSRSPIDPGHPRR